MRKVSFVVLIVMLCSTGVMSCSDKPSDGHNDADLDSDADGNAAGDADRDADNDTHVSSDGDAPIDSDSDADFDVEAGIDCAGRIEDGVCNAVEDCGCEEGTHCQLSLEGATASERCIPDEGAIAIGETGCGGLMNPETICVPGAACVNYRGDATCLELCFSAADCSLGSCRFAVPDAAPYGVCVE